LRLPQDSTTSAATLHSCVSSAHGRFCPSSPHPQHPVLPSTLRPILSPPPSLSRPRLQVALPAGRPWPRPPMGRARAGKIAKTRKPRPRPGRSARAAGQSLRQPHRVGRAERRCIQGQLRERRLPGLCWGRPERVSNWFDGGGGLPGWRRWRGGEIQDGGGRRRMGG
jgi:hypothetical protein